MSSIPIPASSSRLTASAIAPLRRRRGTRSEPFVERRSPSASAASAAIAASSVPAVVEADLEAVAAAAHLQLVRSALGDHEPVVDHGDPVGQAVGLVQVLGGEEHGHALWRRAPRASPTARCGCGVEARRRLVEEDHGRPGDERRGEVEAAAHPAGVGAHEPLAGVGEAERREQLAGALAGRAAAEVVETADHLEVLEAGQVLVHGRVLAGQPDSLAEPAPRRGRRRGRRPAPSRRRAACSVVRIRTAVVLPAPLGPSRPKTLPGLDAQVDAAKGDDVPVALAQPLGLDCGLVGHTLHATEAGRSAGPSASASGRRQGGYVT